MQTIPNVTTADTYTAGCTLEDLNAVAATYVAANAAVIAQFRPKRKDGTQAPWGPELLLSPQSNSMVNVAAMRFRSAVAGVPAQIVAALYDETDALPGAATPFSQTISSSGSVTPGVSAVQIQHNGGLVGSEPTLNLVDATGAALTAVDDPANTRVTVTLPRPAMALLWDSTDAGLVFPRNTIQTPALDQTYKHLKIVGQTLASAANLQMAMEFNGDVGANYSTHTIQSQSTNIIASDSAAQTSMFAGNVGGSNGAFEASIPSYSVITGNGGRVINIRNYFVANNDPHTAGNNYNQFIDGTWISATAISFLTFFLPAGNFVAGTRFSVYGLA